MKKCKKFIVLGIVAAIAAVIAVLVKLVLAGAFDEILYSGKNEDRTIKMVDTLHLLGDLLCWPIDFVRALLP